jgi:hypothetical protein
MRQEQRRWHIPIIGDVRMWLGIAAALVTSWFGMQSKLDGAIANQKNFVSIERMVKVETEIEQLRSRDGDADDALLSLKTDLSDRMNRLEAKIDEVLRWQRKN